MFEKFTDRARKVMQLANREAMRFNHEYIGTEHILLGLIAEGSGVAANVLKNLDIDMGKVRREVERIVQAGPDMVSIGRLPQTPRAKKVLEYSIDEARRLGHDYVGTEHLLLGLLRETEGFASQVLMNLGLDLEHVRAEILRILSSPGAVQELRDLPEPKIVGRSEPDVGHLPPYAQAIVEQLALLIERIQCEKEDRVAAQDFEGASVLWDLERKLEKQKSKFIERWPKGSITD